MTDYALISSSHISVPIENLRAFKQGGHAEGWVVPNDSMLIVDVVPDLPDSPLNAFNYASSTGLTVTIESGEAMVSASPIARDESTDVQLEAGINNQVVYAGFAPASLDSVTVGVDGDFGPDNVRIPIWSFDTDTDSVTGSESLRVLDEYIDVTNSRYETSDGSGTAVDSAERVGDIPAGNVAQTEEPVTFNDTVTIDDPNGDWGLRVIGANEVDSQVAQFIGDADESQKDDLIAAYGLNDPNTYDPTTEIADSASVFAVKGYGRVGINRYDPATALDVAGTITARDSMNLTGNNINNVNVGDINTILSNEIDATTVESLRIRLREFDAGFTMAVADGSRPYIAPYINGNNLFGSELFYRDENDTWEFETPLVIGSKSSRPSSPRVGTLVYRSDKD